MNVKRTALRWLYLGHRWLGIVTCLFFAIWFFSGLVMMYVVYPNLDEKERLAGLPDITWNKVTIAPNAALLLASKAIPLTQFPRDFRLEMMADTPVYRINGWEGERINLSAIDGQLINDVNSTQAEKIAQAFSKQPKARWQETLERDQWTVPNNLNALRPLHRIALNDAAGSELYVSSRTGEVVRDTHRNERFWNWLGSVPHWIYFTPLRADQPLWRQVNLWASGIAIIIPITGIWVGILRLRWRRRYAHGNITPYHGWMKWHHIVGLVGGVFILSWIISGWLSVNPYYWFANRSADNNALLHYSGHVAPTYTDNLPPANEIAHAIGSHAKQISFGWVTGEPTITAQHHADQVMLLDAVSLAPRVLTDAQLVNASQRLMPEAKQIGSLRLTEPDAYWYSHHSPRKLPVLRVLFNDPHQTWIHLDPATGAYLGQSDRNDRAQRWLFSAMHQLDFLWLIQYRPLWDGVMVILISAGLTASISGIVIGVRRLRRRARHRTHHTSKLN